MTETRSRGTRTRPQAPDSSAAFVAALGNDYVATRAVNAILRAEIAQTLDDLKKVAAQDGKKNFLYRIADLPNVGETTQNRIMGAVYPQEI
jgi:hypothetical protein